MAFKKRLVSKKRPLRKRRIVKRKSPTRMLTASAYPFPRVTIRKLKYVTNIQLNSGTASTVASHTFSCNGLYDPDVSGTGHQPYGFDQLMALYNHYEVLSSRIIIRGADSAATNAIIMLCRVDADGNNLTSNAQLLMEMPDTAYKVINPAEAHTTIISQTWNQAKWFGKAKNGADSLSGNSANNPTEQSFFIFGVASADPNADAPNMNYTIELDYVARFYEPRELASS